MKKNPIFVFIGRGGAGKTTQMLKLERLGYQRLVTVTTRQKRAGEAEGVDYYFYDEDKFLADENIILKTESEGLRYGVSLKRLREVLQKNKSPMAQLNTAGAKLLENYVDPTQIKIIYLEIPKRESIKRMVKRGQKLSYIAKRVKADDDFVSAKILQSYKSEIFRIDGMQSEGKVFYELLKIINQCETQNTVVRYAQNYCR